MKVLITGSAGFVGRHLAHTLDAAGHDVAELDIAAPPCHRRQDAVRYFRDATTRYDLVLHCAAFVNGREGIDGSAGHLYTYNVTLDAAMFNWALRTRPGRVVYFSSSAAYPAWLQGPEYGAKLGEDEIDLGQIQQPEATYGLAKLHGEQMAAAARDEGIPVTVLRPFSGYGIDQDLRYPFPAFLARARQRLDPFVVWGSGKQERDWIHISDIVAATLKAAELGIPGPINLGTGRATTFNELAQIVTSAAGYAPDIINDTSKPEGVYSRVADATRLSVFYTPRVELEDAVAAALSA